MDKYKKALPVEKMEMMHKEMNRLQNGYFNYRPDSNLVELKINAIVNASDYFTEDLKKERTTDVNIELVDLPENYFPFYIGGIWIAVIIKDFDKVTKFDFTKKEYTAFAKKFNFKKQRGVLLQKVGVDFKLRPLSVDTSSPVKVDGLEMWLMLAEIGEMRVWRDNFGEKEYLLTHEASWFVSKGREELLRLYHD